MARVDDQVHNRFKLFSGKLDSDGTIGTLAREVAGWVRGANIAPKSIGVEFLESFGQLLLTIGYRDDEPGYGVTLTSVPIAHLEKLGADEVASLERQMEKACQKVPRIICHELYVTDKNELLMVFMSHEA